MKYREIESSGDWLKAKDNLGFAAEVLVTDVTDEDCKDFDTQEPIKKTGLHVDHPKLIGIILLNPSNERALQAKWQDTENTDDWVGRKVFLSTKEHPNYSPGWVVVPIAHETAPVQLELGIPFDDELPSFASEGDIAKALAKAQKKAEKKARKKAKKASAV